jgi:hypothetical protein
MSPVHVIVSEQVADEQQYGAAFAGAIDLYRFRSNVEAYDRLSKARSPIDVLIISPNQDGAFNLATEEFVQQLLASPLASNPHLAAMRIVVVGAAAPANGRVRIVDSLDAAARLIAFGDVGSTPQPGPISMEPTSPSFGAASPLSLDLSFGNPPASLPARLDAPPQLDIPQPAMDSGMLGNIISSIWDAPAPATAATERTAVGGLAPRAAAPRATRQVQASRARRGGAAMGKGNPQRQLFARAQAPTRQPSAPIEPRIEHAPGLEPSVPFVVPSRGMYRGVNQQRQQPAEQRPRSVTTPAAVPQIAQQVQQIVYQQSPPTAPDPLLGWSSPVQQQLAAQQAAAQAPVPQQQVVQQVVAPQQAMPQQMHAVPGNMQAVPVSTHEHSQQVTEIFDAPQGLMNRANSAGDVSFG